MPCTNITHTHVWPVTGVLVVERCERYCQFCTGAKAHKQWPHPWHVRRHVRSVHVKSGNFPGLSVSEDWDDPTSPNYRPRRIGAVRAKKPAAVRTKKPAARRATKTPARRAKKNTSVQVGAQQQMQMQSFPDVDSQAFRAACTQAIMAGASYDQLIEVLDDSQAEFDAFSELTFETFEVDLNASGAVDNVDISTQVDLNAFPVVAVADTTAADYGNEVDFSDMRLLFGGN